MEIGDGAEELAFETSFEAIQESESVGIIEEGMGQGGRCRLAEERGFEFPEPGPAGLAGRHGFDQGSLEFGFWLQFVGVGGEDGGVLAAKFLVVEENPSVQTVAQAVRR